MVVMRCVSMAKALEPWVTKIFFFFFCEKVTHNKYNFFFEIMNNK